MHPLHSNTVFYERHEFLGQFFCLIDYTVTKKWTGYQKNLPVAIVVNDFKQACFTNSIDYVFIITYSDTATKCVGRLFQNYG